MGVKLRWCSEMRLWASEEDVMLSDSVKVSLSFYMGNFQPGFDKHGIVRIIQRVTAASG